MNCVRSVRQVLALGITKLIADQQIPFGISSIIKASGALQIDFELRSCFRSIDAGFSIVAVFDQADIALDDLLFGLGFRIVELNRIKLRFGSDMINRFIQKIAFRRSNLPDGPVISARVIICRELSVLVGRIGCGQFIAFEKPVHSTGE